MMRLCLLLVLVACPWYEPGVCKTTDFEYRNWWSNIGWVLSNFEFNQSFGQPWIVSRWPVRILSQKPQGRLLLSAHCDVVSGTVGGSYQPLVKLSGLIEAERTYGYYRLLPFEPQEESIKHSATFVVPFINLRAMLARIVHCFPEICAGSIAKCNGFIHWTGTGIARLKPHRNTVKSSLWLVSKSNNSEDAPFLLCMDFAPSDGAAFTSLPERVRCKYDSISINDSHNEGGATSTGQKQPRYIRRNDETITVFGKNSQNIEGQDLDVSYDGKEWFHLFGESCMKGAPPFILPGPIDDVASQ